jgi:hypothetical protein
MPGRQNASFQNMQKLCTKVQPIFSVSLCVDRVQIWTSVGRTHISANHSIIVKICYSTIFERHGRAFVAAKVLLA